MFTYEIWDGKSSINGVSAKDIKKIYSITSGSSYIIYAPDGNVQIFQPHKPDKEGRESMTAKEAAGYAQAQVDVLNLQLSSKLDEPREAENE